MKFIVFILVSYILLGCSEDSPTISSNELETKPTGILTTQLDSLDKAKSVEQTLNEAVKAREEEMREKGI